jgi:Ran GTPase-activating protein (RanGAP) involved in mRNA processing and transport
VIIGEVLKENTILQVLSLSDNHLGNDGIAYISIGLSKNRTLHTLNLKNNGITFAGSFIFSSNMVKNKTLQEINLDRNHIDSLGLSYICQYINTNTLQKLSLDKNDVIDVNGILPVITALKSNRGLLELKINCNQEQRLVRDMDTITMISSKLIEMLEYNTTIQEITLMYTVYLSENNMNSSYSFCLAHNNEIIMLLLKRNKVIKHIAIMRIHRFWRDVCYNPTYSHARERLCRGLETPPESKKRKREDELA